MTDLEKMWGPMISKQANKIRLDDQGVRDGYYAAADGVHALIRALTQEDFTIGDVGLRGEALKVQQALTRFYKVLDSRYDWD